MNQNLYIDRDTSSVIKGVLIILIVMGHNKVIIKGLTIFICFMLYVFLFYHFFMIQKRR
jgi:fucose 4-O-acetylase-like acetyltransferase